MAKSEIESEAAAKKALEKATKEWREAKKYERAARNEVARIVVDVVRSGLITENKAAKISELPRMTVRKMLGKN